MSNNSYNSIAGKSTERIIAISDGVFAVALTLLVLEIRIPAQNELHSEQDLIQLFISLAPKFLVYFLAFMTAGIFWMGHSAQYKNIDDSDRNLSWINLIFLLSVTLLPFSTAFLGDYITFKFSILIYWLNIFLMGILLYINWLYASKKGFIAKEKFSLVDTAIRSRIIIAQTLYFVGFLLCFINNYTSIAFIIVVQANYAFAFIKEKRKNK